jgi:hypothetical protein
MSRVLSSTNEDLKEKLLFYKEDLENVYSSLNEDDKDILKEYYDKYMNYIEECLNDDDIDKDTCFYALEAGTEYLRIFLN